MMKTINVILPHLQDTIDFVERDGGWYVNDKHGLSIDPQLETCTPHIWHADHICMPPSYEFIVN